MNDENFQDTLTPLNTTPLINRSAVKKMAIDISNSTRNGKFTRVSKGFLERINARLNNMIKEEIRGHPSVGKTLM